jgi:copper transport protein
VAPHSSVAAVRLTAALLILALCLFISPTAWAHAVLLETRPEDGTRFEVPPREAWLRFNEPVIPVAVRVLGTGGAVVSAPDAVSGDGETIRIALPDDLPKGSYIISYRATSADGHPVAGSIVFGIGTAPATAPVASPIPDRAGVAAVALRAIHYAALLATAGGGLFIVLVLGRGSPVRERLTPALCLSSAVAAVAAVSGIGLAGATLQGAAVDSLLTAGVWQIGLATSVGLAGLIALGSLLASMTGLALRGGTGTTALILGALLASASLATTGHAATAPPQWLSRLVVFIHGLMGAYWVGALWPLLVVLRTTPATESVRIVRRFSRLAVSGVVALVLAGVILSILQLGSLDAMVTTFYGWVWLTKVILVIALLTLAAINRQRLTPALAEGGPGARRRLERSIRAEIVVVAGIILATASFGLTPPPRALVVQDAAVEAHHHEHGSDTGEASEEAHGYATVVTVGDRTAIIEIDPAHPGRNQVKAHLTGPDSSVLTPLEATIELALPDAGIEPISRPLSISAQGSVIGDLDLPLAGRWTLALSVLVSDFERVTFRTELIIQE